MLSYVFYIFPLFPTKLMFSFQPSVSVGNVGQLATDVILASLKPQLVTSIYHEAILPVVGLDPLNMKSEQLMTACQLYKTDSVAILQIRSGIVPNKREEFLNDLAKWIKLHKFAKVILLTSTSSEERLDIQIRGSPFRFLSKDFHDELQ